jgi:hypothetical protein
MFIKKPDSLLPYLIPLAVIGVAIAAMIIIAAINWASQPNATSAPVSYQAQNLETLKTVQPNDLVLCVVDMPGTLRPEIKFAFLVEQNASQSLHGYQINVLSLVRTIGGGYPYSRFDNCKIEVQRDTPTGNMPAHLGRIILYGLNNPQHLIH